MSQIVKCEICGHIYNERYLQIHMRRSHGKAQNGASFPTSEQEAIEEILSLSKRLSEKGRKYVLERLSAPRAEKP